MNEGKIINFIPYIFVLIFAASTAYFFIGSLDRSSKSSPTQTALTNPTSKASPTTTAQNEQSTLTYTKPAASSKRPSNPAETYTLGIGEGLSMVGEKLDINWQIIASINNISNVDSVQANQVLIIPALDEGLKKLVINFKIDEKQAQNLQKQASSKKDLVYLDPVLTAKADVPPIYGLTNEDTFTNESTISDSNTIITVAHDNKNYEIQLVQPLTKGKEGIWAVSKIIAR